MAGWRTTYGSPLFADHVPDVDDLIVERIRHAGAVPRRQDERARVRGRLPHLQPGLRHDPQPGRPHAGRPAGPAAARPARWPPGWCRSPRAPTWAAACATRRRSAGWWGCGRRSGGCPTWPASNQWETTSVGGPMGRTVGDVALLLSVIAGPDPRVPLALGRPGSSCSRPRSRAPWRACAWATRSTSAGPSRSTRRWPTSLEGAGRLMVRWGASVFDAHPDLTGADETFRTLRAWHFQATFGDLLRRHPDDIKPTLAENIRAGEGLTGADVSRAFEQPDHAGRVDAPVLPAVRRAGAARRRRSRRSRPTRSTPPRSPAGRWTPTSTGCGRRTSSP